MLLLLRSNPSSQHSKALYHWEVRKRGKTGKHGKSRSEERVLGFSLTSLFPTRKRKAVTQGGRKGIDQLMQRTQGAGIVKGWEDKQDQGCIPDTFT